MRRAAALLAILAATSCSFAVSDATEAPTAFVPIVSPPPLETSTALPPVSTPSSTSQAIWRDRGLTGQIIFTQSDLGLARLDLGTGELSTLFAPAEGAWLSGASVAPDGSQVVLAYAPPPPEGQVQLGYTDLYLLDIGCSGSAPCQADGLRPLLERAVPNEAFFSPAWSPDGQYIYFAHLIPADTANNRSFQYNVERMALPGGNREVLVENAFWPRLSPDGSRLAYVTLEVTTFDNDLYLADADGSNPRQLIGAEMFEAVDAPLFTPDATGLVFSAVGDGPTVSRLDWLDGLLGVQTAEAAPERHNVPSDWWYISTTGEGLKRLTRVLDTGLLGDFSPDGRHVAYTSVTGLYVMNPDGTDPLLMLNAAGGGAVDWIP